MPTFDEILYELERSLVFERGLSPVDASHIVETLRSNPTAVRHPPRMLSPVSLPHLAQSLLDPINEAMAGALLVTDDYQTRLNEITRSLGLDTIMAAPREDEQLFTEMLEEAARDPDYSIVTFGPSSTFAVDRIEGVNVGDPFIHEGVTMGRIVNQTPNYTMISINPSALNLPLGGGLNESVSMGATVRFCLNCDRGDCKIHQESVPDGLSLQHTLTRFQRQDPL